MKAVIVLSSFVLLSFAAGCGSNPSSTSDSNLSSVSPDQVRKKRVTLFYEKDADEPYTGQIIEKYRSGQTQVVVNVVNGMPSGVMTEWYESGQKKREADLESKETGHVKEWYESGQMKSDGEMLRGRPDGLVTKWYENGQIESQETFVNGRSQEKLTWDEYGTSTTIHAVIRAAMDLSGGAKAAVTEYYQDRGEFPADNASAGLSDGSKITGKYVTSVVVDAGVITISLGRDSDAEFAGRVLIFTPMPSRGSVKWECSGPDIDPALLPETCR